MRDHFAKITIYGVKIMDTSCLQLTYIFLGIGNQLFQNISNFKEKIFKYPESGIF